MPTEEPSGGYYTKYNPANDRNFLDRWARSPYPAWANSALCLTAFQLALRKVPGLPYPLYSFGFAVPFALAGYASHIHDYEIGAGVCTAWSLSWALVHSYKAVRSRQWQSLTILGLIS
ncbi:hypothetical protein IWQ60_010595, partial [Tieghemiomyces parasiticus]